MYLQPTESFQQPYGWWEELENLADIERTCKALTERFTKQRGSAPGHQGAPNGETDQPCGISSFCNPEIDEFVVNNVASMVNVASVSNAAILASVANIAIVINEAIMTNVATVAYVA